MYFNFPADCVYNIEEKGVIAQTEQFSFFPQHFVKLVIKLNFQFCIYLGNFPPIPLGQFQTNLHKWFLTISHNQLTLNTSWQKYWKSQIYESIITD